MSPRLAFTGAHIFDGASWHEDAALIVADRLVEAIVARTEIPAGAAITDLGGGVLAPGFVDLQVNGGDGAMFNDAPSYQTIRTICAAHRRYGTTSLLPTLITDTPQITEAAISAGVVATLRNVPGFLGLHLEGPHLSLARKGAHDPNLIRPMTNEDEAELMEAAGLMRVLLATVAPESVGPAQVAALSQAGVVVSLGHSDTSHALALDYVRQGATMVTHLFNAMSQLGSREPGLAGAAIDSGAISCGLIADGVHVDPATIGIALRAKRGPGSIFLVTDAMATLGTDLGSFTLNGRTVYRKDGSLRLEDGTLAGADLDMASAVRFMHRVVGLELGEALRMASAYPANAVGQAHRIGGLTPGMAADMVALSDELEVEGVWIGGAAVAGRSADSA